MTETRSAVGRVAIFVAIFGALSYAGIRWAAPEAATEETWRAFAALPPSTHALLAALAVGLVLAEALRFALFGRALRVSVGARAALDASIATTFFSWITPFAFLGEPAGVYVLGRRGVPWDAAAVITYAKFATSFVFIMGLTAVLATMGLGPALPAWIVAPFVVATGAVAVLLAMLLLGALAPARTTAVIDAIERRLPRARIVEVLAREGRRGIERLSALRPSGLVLVFVGHTIYFAIFVGILVVLAIAFGATDVTRTAARAVIYQGFVYVVPTPGGAGVGEATAELFFGEIVSAGRAFVVIVLFRALTFYLHVALGLIYLPITGGLDGRIFERRFSR